MSKPAIKLMPDYGCSPIWHCGGGEVGPIEPATLGVSDTLAAKLASWADTFDSHLNVGDPAATTWTEGEQKQFDADGRRLCRDLAAEMGDRFDVFYSSRCIPAGALHEEA